MYGWNSKILLLVAPLCVVPLGAAAQSDFYKGKSLNVYIGFAPGGSSDIISRLLAQK